MCALKSEEGIRCFIIFFLTHLSQVLSLNLKLMIFASLTARKQQQSSCLCCAVVLGYSAWDNDHQVLMGTQQVLWTTEPSPTQLRNYFLLMCVCARTRVYRMCMCEYGHMCAMSHVETRGHLLVVSSLLKLWILGLNSDLKAWLERTGEPSQRPIRFFIIFLFFVFLRQGFSM